MKKIKIIIIDDNEMVVIDGKTSEVYLQKSFLKNVMGVAIVLNEVKKEITKKR